MDSLICKVKKLYIEPCKRKRYRNKHREEYKQWRNSKQVCTICCGFFTNTNKSTHTKTSKHRTALKIKIIGILWLLPLRVAIIIIQF